MNFVPARTVYLDKIEIAALQMTQFVPPLHTSVLALEIGQSARVNVLLNSAIALKLLEMGCLPGKEITLLNVTSLGGPVLIKVGEQRIALRREEAAHILIDDKH